MQVRKPECKFRFPILSISNLSQFNSELSEPEIGVDLCSSFAGSVLLYIQVEIIHFSSILIDIIIDFLCGTLKREKKRTEKSILGSLD